MKKKKNKMYRGMPTLAICLSTSSFKLKLFGSNQQLQTDRETDIMTNRLNWPLSQFSENIDKPTIHC